MKLRLDRTKDVFAEVPDDAEFVLDLKLDIVTKAIYDPVSGRNKILKLGIAKIWVKQSDGTFKLQTWPCDALYPEGHKRK